jgi:putative NADH-flavin reductase
MRILLLGATGRTGKYLLEQALAHGHIVHALVRDKQKIPIQKYNLLLFQGSPADNAALDNAMRGCEAILSALNISRKYEFPWAGLRTPKDFLSTTMKIIVELSAKNNIRRVVFTSAWGVSETKKDLPRWFRWLVDNSSLRYQYHDHERQEELARKSNLDWTAVRPVFLTNSHQRKEITVNLDDKPQPHLYISRQSLAMFMLQVLEKNLYLCQAPVVSEK